MNNGFYRGEDGSYQPHKPLAVVRLCWRHNPHTGKRFQFTPRAEAEVCFRDASAERL
jgi:hypothetical protein